MLTGHSAWATWLAKTLYILKYNTPISKTVSRISDLICYMVPTVFLNN